MRQIFRVLLALLSVATWIPPVMILVMGGLYLIDFYQFLLSPGLPVSLKYKAEKGEALLEVDSYAIDPGTRRLSLFGLRVRDAHGSQMLAAKKLEVWQDGAAIQARCDRAEARLDRVPSGGFDLGGVLPKSQKGGEFGLRAAVEEAVIDYRDHVAGKRVQAKVTGLTAELGDSDMIAKALVGLDGSEPAQIALHLGPKGKADVWADLPKVEAAPYLGVLRSWLPKEAVAGWKDLTAESLAAEGQARIALADKEAPIVDVQLRFSGRNVTLPGVFHSWTGSGRARLKEGLAAMDAVVVRGGEKLEFKGGAELDPLRAAGAFRLKSRSPRELWPELASLLPKGSSYRDADFQGALTWDKGVKVSGQVAARQASYGQDQAANMNADLGYDGQRLTAAVSRGSLYGRPLKGWVDWLPKPDVLSAWVSSEAGPLEEAAARAGQKGLKGEGLVEGVVKGSSARPLVLARASVRGRWTFDPKERPITISQGDFRVEVTKDGLGLQRGTVLTPSGIVSAAGGMTWDGGLNFLLEASGIRIASYVQGLDGTGFFQGKVTGSVKSPRVSGEAEAYGLEAAGREMAWLKGEVSYGPNGASADNLRGQAGGGAISGQASWNPKTDAISGWFEANNLLFNDWIPAEIYGAFEVAEGRISGTAKDPLATALLRARRTLAYGVKAESVEARLSADRHAARIGDARVATGSGQLSGSGSYNLETTALAGKFSFENFPLSRLPTPPEALLSGVASGTVVVSGSSEKGPVVTVDAGVNDLRVNSTPIGSGQASARIDGTALTAQGEVGSVERFLSLNSLTADLDKRTFEAKADVLNFDLNNLLKAARNSWDDQPVDVQEAIRGAQGQLSARILASGSWADPDFVLQDASASQLRAFGRTAGELKLAGSKKGSLWTLDSLEWLSDDMALRAGKSTYSKDKGLEASFDLQNFDLTWLSRVSASMPGITGKANVTAMATGPIDSPQVQATVFARDGALQGPNGADIELFEALNLDSVEVTNRALNLGGTLRLRGFLGDLSASVPFDAFDKDKTAEAKADMKLRPRPLAEFLSSPTEEGASPKIEGLIKGSATISGRQGSWKTAADLFVSGSKADIPGLSTGVKDFDLHAQLRDKELSLEGKAAGSRGGTAALDGVRATFPLLFEDGRSISEILQESRLRGRVVLNGLGMSEPLAANTQESSATAEGEITLGGSAAASKIGGNIRVLGANIIIPSAFPEAASSEPLPFEPEFDNLRIEAGPQSTVRFGLGFLKAHGVGTVSGPLSALNVKMPLSVEAGLLRLPNAKIGLVEGGTVDVSMQGASGLPLQILVDMEGQTSLTARRGVEQYETYDVTLQFRGDLLNPDGLNFTASSDPGDLTSQEILAILGQRELVEALAASALQGKGTAGLRDPLYQIGIPNLTDPLTAKLATALQLNYLSVDYNPFDQAILRFGKNLGAGLTLQGWRQISEPQAGPLKYDLRLSWRPRFGGRAFDRVRIGLGTTHDRPYRLTVDWSRRW